MPSTKMKKITEKKPKYDFDGRKLIVEKFDS